jgi:hypothetical protein
MAKWFSSSPFWHNNQGRDPREARAHLFALQAVRKGMQGFLLLDGDNRDLPDHEIGADGLSIGRWRRYETESYLVHPEALLRYAESAAPLFLEAGRAYLNDQIPPAVMRNPLQDHVFTRNTPVSKTLIPEFFQAANVAITKKEYYLVAEQMRPEEVHPEVAEKLDQIQKALGL